MLNVIKFLVDFLSTFLKLMKEYGKKYAFVFILFSVCSVGISLFLESKLDKNINTTLESYETYKKENHLVDYFNSQNFYLGVKSMLKSHMEHIGCDYILFIDYHNGSENAITKIQFCKFDVTMEIRNPELTYFNDVKFTDESIYNYDILFTNEQNVNKINIYNIDDIKTKDLHFYHLVTSYHPTAKKVVTSDIKYANDNVGMLVFIFNDQQEVNPISIINCTSIIEEDIEKNIKSENNKK